MIYRIIQWFERHWKIILPVGALLGVLLSLGALLMIGYSRTGKVPNLWQLWALIIAPLAQFGAYLFIGVAAAVLISFSLVCLAGALSRRRD